MADALPAQRARVAWKRSGVRPSGAPSPRRIRAWQRLRSWEQAKDLRVRQWKTGLHVRNLLAQQAARRARGAPAYYPHPVPELHGELRTTLERDLVGWVVFAARLYSGALLIGQYSALAELLDCTSRWVQKVVEGLTREGYLVVNAHYVEEPDATGKVVAWSLANSFGLGPKLRAMLATRARLQAAARFARRAGVSQAAIDASLAAEEPLEACEEPTACRSVAESPPSMPSAVLARARRGTGAAGSVRRPAAAGSWSPTATPSPPQAVAAASDRPRARAPERDPDPLRSLSDRSLDPNASRSPDRTAAVGSAPVAPRSRSAPTRLPRGAPVYPGRQVVLREQLSAVVATTGEAPWQPFDDRARGFLALLRQLGGDE